MKGVTGDHTWLGTNNSMKMATRDVALKMPAPAAGIQRPRRRNKLTGGSYCPMMSTGDSASVLLQNGAEQGGVARFITPVDCSGLEMRRAFTACVDEVVGAARDGVCSYDGDTKRHC